MYNQYITPPREEVHKERREDAAEAMAPQQPHLPQQPPHPPQQQHPPHPPQAASAFGNLSQVLGSRLGSVKFDAETLIALAVIWFLINDGGELDSELLMIIGIMLILGI